MAKSNYRKLYEQTYQIIWDSRRYEIHHIDLDRQNNDIDNLLLLPRKLHRNIHKALRQADFAFRDGATFKEVVYESMFSRLQFNGMAWYEFDFIDDIITAVNACDDWVMLKYDEYTDNLPDGIAKIYYGGKH